MFETEETTTVPRRNMATRHGVFRVKKGRQPSNQLHPRTNRAGKYKQVSSKAESPGPTRPSAVNIVLLGRTGAGKSASGNTILGEEKFESKFGAKSKTKECAEATAHFKRRRVTVLDTPGLFDTTHGMERFEEEMEKVKKFANRGRCIFLLVIELGRFTEEEDKSIRKILKSFDEPMNKFMILFTNGDRLDGTIEEFLEEADDNLQGVLNEFDNRYHVFNNNNKLSLGGQQVCELLSKMDRLLAERDVEQVTKENFRSKNDEDRVEQIWQKLLEKKSLEEENEATTQEPLRFVLLGKTGTGKSATGNTILGRDGFVSKKGMRAVTKESEKLEGTVCGRKVTVVDTPGFFGNSGSIEQIRQEAAKSICLSAPGPHAFLVVMSLNERLSTDVKDTIKELHEKFGENFKKYTIILFSHLDHLAQETVEDVIQSDPELLELLRPFENRIHAFNNKDRSSCDQVRELFKMVDGMVEQNRGGCYTNEVYRVAEEAIEQETRRLSNKHQDEIVRRAGEGQQDFNRESGGEHSNTSGNQENPSGNEQKKSLWEKIKEACRSIAESEMWVWICDFFSSISKFFT